MYFKEKVIISPSYFLLDLFYLKMFSVLTHVVFFFSLQLALNMAGILMGPFSILTFSSLDRLFFLHIY